MALELARQRQRDLLADAARARQAAARQSQRSGRALALRSALRRAAGSARWPRWRPGDERPPVASDDDDALEIAADVPGTVPVDRADQRLAPIVADESAAGPGEAERDSAMMGPP